MNIDRVSLPSDWAGDPISAKAPELSLVEPAGIEADLSCVMGMPKDHLMPLITSFFKL